MSRSHSHLEKFITTNWASLVRCIPKRHQLKVGVNGDPEAHMCLTYRFGNSVYVFDPNGSGLDIPISAYDKSKSRTLLERSVVKGTGVYTMTFGCEEDPHTMLSHLTTLKGGVCFLICIAVHNHVMKYVEKVSYNDPTFKVGLLSMIKAGFLNARSTRDFLLSGMPDKYVERIASFI